MNLLGVSFAQECGLRYCDDCTVRCFLQRRGDCVGVVYNGTDHVGLQGTGCCTYYSRVDATQHQPDAGETTLVAAVLSGYVPPEPAQTTRREREEHDQSRPAEVLISFSGAYSCNYSTGGVIDMTGSLDPSTQSGVAVGYYNSLPDPGQGPKNHSALNPGELAQYPVSQLQSAAMQYRELDATSTARVRSAGMFYRQIREPDRVHVCSYCNMDKPMYC